jgi:hypothetical protein
MDIYCGVGILLHNSYFMFTGELTGKEPCWLKPTHYKVKIGTNTYFVDDWINMDSEFDDDIELMVNLGLTESSSGGYLLKLIQCDIQHGTQGKLYHPCDDFQLDKTEFPPLK